MVIIRNFCIFFWLLALVLPIEAKAEELLNIEVSKHFETIIISTDSTSPHKVFLLPNPDRLVVDIPTVGGRYAVSLTDSYKGKLLKAIRFGQFNPHTSRFVFELTRPVTIKKIHDNEDGRLAIDMADDEKENAAVPNESKKSLTQKKAQKPMIVIDPGHGGQDPGTSGPGGSDEKDVVLAYAKTLKAKLLKTGRYQVTLTREDDEFIPLRGRVQIARKAGASIFISLHADSAPDLSARGLSVYTVSQKASDQESEALAARENKSDIIAGMDLSDESRDVADILISLAERDTKNRSATLADVLVTSLDDEVHLLSNSHRFAGFAVLKAPDVPSVLIEIGFLSHPSEEKLIESKTYREKVTSGIADGIDRYFVVEKRLGQP